MFPLALACDAVLTATGEMIGDPTEGALVVLAEKGGPRPRRHARALPARRRAAVRHRLQADGDVPPHDRRVGPRGRPLLRQGRAGPAARARRRRTSTRRWRRRRRTTAFKARYLAENERLAAQGLRVMATARKDFDAAGFDPGADLLELMDGPHAAGAGRHRRPAAPGGQGGDRHGARRRHPGPHDHRRPRDHRRGDRAASSASRAARSPARSSPSSARTQADERDRRHRRDRARDARAEGPARRHPQAQGPRRRHDGRRRQRRAGAQAGRHRHRDGHHRHRGLQGGRGDDPHRRQLRDDRQGRRARARALRQPRQVHPLPDGRAGRDDRRRSSARASSTSSAGSRSCRCRRCGSTSPRRSSSRSGSATASRARG